MSQLISAFSLGLERTFFGDMPKAYEDPQGSLTSIGLVWRIIIGWATLPRTEKNEGEDRKIDYNTQNFHPAAAVIATATFSLATIILGESSISYIPHSLRFPVKIITYALALIPLHHIIGLTVKSARDLIDGQELPPPIDRCH